MSDRAPSPPALTNAQRVMTEAQLTSRHRLMIEYMVYGVRHESIRERLALRYVPAGFDVESGAPLKRMGRPELHEPLSIEDAAAACNVRARVARQLAKQAVFQRLLNAETEAFRESAKVRAWRRIDAIVHEPGLGKAADRKVQLAAAQLITGEGNDRGITINMPGSTQITAGVVIRMPARDRPRAEPPMKTIDHKDQP